MIQESFKELEKIGQHHLFGDYTKAYESLVKICCDNQEYKDFLNEAECILSRYRRIYKKNCFGILDQSEMIMQENQISYSYYCLIEKMKDSTDKNFEKKSYCEQCILYARKKCIELGNIRREIEREVEFCKNDDHRNAMINSFRHINEIIIHFCAMIRNFTVAQKYE